MEEPHTERIVLRGSIFGEMAIWISEIFDLWMFVRIRSFAGYCSKRQKKADVHPWSKNAFLTSAARYNDPDLTFPPRSFSIR
jgi:hypothetical protein